MTRTDNRKSGKKRKTERQNVDSIPVKLQASEANNSLAQSARTNSKKLEETDVTTFAFNKKRVRVLTDAEDIPENSGCNGGVVYWMSRDQRLQDNWALLYAQRLALKCETSLHVCFCLVPKFLDATIRHYRFMLKGLEEVSQECTSLNISFHLLLGEASTVLPKFINDYSIQALVADFSPLRTPLKWLTDVKENLPSQIPFCQVDAHNIVPCWEASGKLEYAARTIRSKIQKQLPEYLTEFPRVIYHPFNALSKPEPVDWNAAEASLEVNRNVGDVDWATPGTMAGLQTLEEFCTERLKGYATGRNDPNKNQLSMLSPWMHFGQISVQRCVLEVNKYKNKWRESAEAFIEEAVVRRELSDNFCFYNPKYDQIDGANDWAKQSLEAHKKDKRPHLYTREQLEDAKTYDDLWNAAQLQMVHEGKMHGFLRMYWAKKILEWTKSPEEALAISIYLNDKYELDGRDPNGYVGCMWSICGIHDMGWKERPIFGKIRYMNYNGCKRKFDIQGFVAKYNKYKTK